MTRNFLCILAAAAAVAAGMNSAANISPRRTGGRQDETIVELTDRGKALEAEYTDRLNALKAALEKALPKIDDAQKTAFLEAFKAEAEPAADVRHKTNEIRIIKGREDNLLDLQEQLKYAPAMVADAEAVVARAQALPDGTEDKDEEVKDAQRVLGLRQGEADALPGKIEKAKAAVAQMEQDLAEATKAYEAAVKVHQQAKAETLKSMNELKAGHVIVSDKLDPLVARHMVISEATPRFLAQFAQQGPEKKQLIDKLLSDTPLMIQMLVADGPFWEKYGEAMEIYTAIQEASPRAKDGLFQRLALAVSLVHAVPIIQRNAEAATDAPKYVDPIQRYLNYEKWYLAGELDPAFKDHSVWNLTMVVNSGHPDDIHAWGRDMMRQYRPDLIPADGNTALYVDVVDAEIAYTSKNVYRDRPEQHFFQNILANGGICGRRAFFGRFILRSFGVPTAPRPEPGHATLTHWSPAGWQNRLGGQWGGRARVHVNDRRYRRDLNFLANTQAREDAAGFLNVKRAQRIGALQGEVAVCGRIIPDQGANTPRMGFWHAVAFTEQQRIIDALGSEAVYAPADTVPVAPRIEISAADRRISVDNRGVISIPAVACSDPLKSTKRLFRGRFRESIVFQHSYAGGKQLYLSRYAEPSDTFEYKFDAPRAGTYHMSARLITPAPDQTLDVLVNGAEKIEWFLPYTVGLWDKAEPIAIDLVQGENKLTFIGPARVTVKAFTLTPVK